MVKWKQSGKVIFFEKNLRTQFDVVFDSESNGGIFETSFLALHFSDNFFNPQFEMIFNCQFFKIF